MNKVLAAVGLLAALFATSAHAQSYWTDAGGAVHSGVVDMSLNASSQPVPDSSANPHPVTCISGCASPAVPSVAPTGASLAVTSSTGNVAFANSTSTYPVVLLLNDGSTEIFVNLGNSSVTAATTNIPIPAGNSIQVGIGSATNVAGITASLTSTLRVIQLTGPTNWAGGGGGGGSSSNASVSATGTLVPGSATYAGINIGGNLTGLVGGHGTAANAMRVELPTDGTGLVTTNPANIATVGLMSGTTPGTAPSNTLIIGGIYNSSPPSPSSGNTLPLQLTAGGSLHVTADNSNSNGQATMASSSPVALASNQSVADPCMFQVKKNIPISTSSGNTQLLAGSGSTKVYICATHIVGAAAWVGNVIEGTGAACTTANEAAIWGSTTAASGDSFAANGGMTYGNGEGMIGVTATAGNGICLLQSGTVALSGNMMVVQQ